ncbi:MAG: hypothetical protein ABEJ93_01750 [Candidatus Nanohalobium sp.]
MTKAGNCEVCEVISSDSRSTAPRPIIIDTTILRENSITTVKSIETLVFNSNQLLTQPTW